MIESQHHSQPLWLLGESYEYVALNIYSGCFILLSYVCVNQVLSQMVRYAYCFCLLSRTSGSLPSLRTTKGVRLEYGLEFYGCL